MVVSITTLLENSIAHPIDYRFMLKDLCGSKIRPNLRKQTISKIKVIKND